MRKLALTLSALGLLTFAGVARADRTTENSDKTDTSTTLSGKHKTVHTKKVERADGMTTETKTETITPKDADRRDNMDRRDEIDTDAKVKTEHHRTLTGKDETKTTKKFEKPDGTQVESTTTVTEPKDRDPDRK